MRHFFRNVSFKLKITALCDKRQQQQQQQRRSSIDDDGGNSERYIISLNAQKEVTQYNVRGTLLMIHFVVNYYVHCTRLHNGLLVHFHSKSWHNWIINENILRATKVPWP